MQLVQQSAHQRLVLHSKLATDHAMYKNVCLYSLASSCQLCSLAFANRFVIVGTFAQVQKQTVYAATSCARYAAYGPAGIQSC